MLAPTAPARQQHNHSEGNLHVVRMLKRAMPNPSHDYDSSWKEALERYLPGFREFLFPEANRDIDWSRGYEFLDKELQRRSKCPTSPASNDVPSRGGWRKASIRER